MENNHVDYDSFFNDGWRRASSRQCTCEDLEMFIKELERCRDKLVAMGGRQGKNNSTAHNMFWEKLMRVWYAEVGKGIVRPQKQPANFLLACFGAVFSRRDNAESGRHFRAAPHFPQISLSPSTLFAFLRT
jgi:hypothetical protein